MGISGYYHLVFIVPFPLPIHSIIPKHTPARHIVNIMTRIIVRSLPASATITTKQFRHSRANRALLGGAALSVGCRSSQFLATQTAHVVVIMIGEALQLNVVHFGHQQLVQQLDQLPKHRSVLEIARPTIVHNVVQLTATVLRLLQPIAIAHFAHHIRGRDPRIRCRTQRHNLPHQNAETPNVRLHREEVVVQRFDGHPPIRRCCCCCCGVFGVVGGSIFHGLENVVFS